MEIINNIPGMPKRPSDSHKGDYGKILLIGGSGPMPGAITLSAWAALRSGAGLVRLAVPDAIYLPVALGVPCATCQKLSSDSEERISGSAWPTIENMLSQNDVLAMGPGLGVSTALADIIGRIIGNFAGFIVLDADALNNLCQKPEKLHKKCIITPHFGEFQRLWQAYCDDNIPEDRSKAAGMLALKTGAIVILKGQNTIVTDGQKVYTNTTGNAGMATGGSGDVLTGVIAALAGNKIASFDALQAAILGVLVHSTAGDIAAARFGPTSMMASDIIDSLPRAWRNIS